MGSHPTLSELERAIMSYMSPSSKIKCDEWRVMPWLWPKLSWRARFIARFGGANAQWWKEKYIFSILCNEASPHFQRFLQGEWTRTEEESLRYCFHFFSPYAARISDLFPSEITAFLMGVCPSFNSERKLFQMRLSGKGISKNCSWLQDETFIRYRSRMHKVIANESMPKKMHNELEECISLSTESLSLQKETQNDAKLLIDAMVRLRDASLQVASALAQDIAWAFPLRLETENEMVEFQNVKENLISLSLEIDRSVDRFQYDMSHCLSDIEAKCLIKNEEKKRRLFQKSYSDLRIQRERYTTHFTTIRSRMVQRLQLLTRGVDRIPMLEESHPFRIHQMRVIRMAREKIKQFRQSLSKGPGPGMLFVEIEQDIYRLEELAKAFYKEGSDISTMKVKLLKFEHRLQELSLRSSSISLSKFLSEVAELKNTLEIASDRNHRFEACRQAVRELEVGRS